jgi:hypothetical protein
VFICNLHIRYLKWFTPLTFMSIAYVCNFQLLSSSLLQHLCIWIGFQGIVLCVLLMFTGNCLINGQTYVNNSAIPPASHCQLSCRCVSSIVHCILVKCSPPPPHHTNCMPVHHGGDSCCPTYTCGKSYCATLTGTKRKNLQLFVNLMLKLLQLKEIFCLFSFIISVQFSLYLSISV